MKKTQATRRGLVRSIVWTAALLVLAPLFAQEGEYSDGGRVLRRCPRDATSFTIPSTVLEINDHAFAGCSMLESVTIPDSVREIEDEAFRGCVSLASITIPASVREIEDDAFWAAARWTASKSIRATGPTAVLTGLFTRRTRRSCAAARGRELRLSSPLPSPSSATARFAAANLWRV